jgi:hypothetical protein
MSDYREFGLLNTFIDHLRTRLGTTSIYKAIADFRTTNHCTLSLLSLLSLVVSWLRILTMEILQHLWSRRSRWLTLHN